jgi:hypothetical protein
LAVPVGLLLDAEAAGELEDGDELDELALHAAANAVQPMVSRATAVALFLATRGIIPRRLPLIVALRK